MKKVVSSGIDPLCDLSDDREASSSSTDPPHRTNTNTVAELLQDDTAHRRLLEAGSELMLQQHLDYNGCLTVNEQIKWKRIVINALSDKTFNDTSKFLIEKLREPYKTKLLKILYSNCGLLDISK